MGNETLLKRMRLEENNGSSFLPRNLTNFKQKFPQKSHLEDVLALSEPEIEIGLIVSKIADYLAPKILFRQDVAALEAVNNRARRATQLVFLRQIFLYDLVLARGLKGARGEDYFLRLIQDSFKCEG